MRTGLLVLAVAAAALGCQDSTPQTAPAPASAPTSDAKPTASETPATPPEAKPKATAEDPSTNQGRVYQLKDLQVVKLQVAGKTIPVWVMDTKSKQEEGMMFLTDKEVKDDEGMIFPYSSVQATDRAFWNHNCPLALDIIFIDKDRKVINVGQAMSENDASVSATKPYQYVLELKQGWSKKHGLKPGDPVGIPPSLKAKD
ncbi:MAG TPA: DUF192 domain-containing protein [Fimbriimonas sp.]|nr:DUF192 domain-containing protein [Fimbriimonas sp.]